MDFSAWIVERPDGRRRRHLADRLQRRRAARRGDARARPDPRAGTGAEDGDGLPAADRFRTGVTLAMFTLVVFTIVVGATTSGAFLRAVDDVEAYGGGFDVRAQVAPTSPIGDAGAASAAPGWTRRLPRGRQRDGRCPAECAQAGDRGRRRRIRCAASTTPSSGTTYRLAAIATGYDSSQRGLAGAAPRPISPWSTRWPRRGATTGASPRRPSSGCTASTSRTGRSSRCRSRSAIPPGSIAHAHGHRRARRHGADRDGRDVDLAARRWRTSSADARHADHPPRQARARRGSGRAPPRARERVPRQRHGGEVDRRTSTRPSARRTRSTGCCSASWAGADRRRRRARRDQRPLGGRAASADRRAARDRLPPRHGPAQLPARVVLHRADRDRGRQRARPDHRVQRRPGRCRSAVAGRARCTSSCRGRTSPSCSAASMPRRC